MKTPVGLDGGELGVVVVVVAVAGADEMRGHGVAEQDAVDLVLHGVVFVLVEGDEDEGVVHEALVGQERGEELGEPLAGGGYIGVVAVAGHVGSDEHPLGELVVLKVFIEEGCVLDPLETVLLVGNGVVEDLRAVGSQ